MAKERLVLQSCNVGRCEIEDYKGGSVSLGIFHIESVSRDIAQVATDADELSVHVFGCEQTSVEQEVRGDSLASDGAELFVVTVICRSQMEDE